ncbi:MAG: hypothetical protein HY826_03375 [Actinobacteria bacterium]|nr:hypothetical protein [Actinomycetota bacterium]
MTSTFEAARREPTGVHRQRQTPDHTTPGRASRAPAIAAIDEGAWTAIEAVVQLGDATDCSDLRAGDGVVVEVGEGRVVPRA